MKLFSIIFLLLLKESSYFVPKEVCIKNKTYLKCPKKFNFNCGQQFCALNKMECQKFISFNELIIKITNENDLKKSNLLREYLYSKIEYCPKKWTSKDVCLNNEKKCLYKNFKMFPLIESQKYMVKCSCEKLFSYKCGEDYCSKDKHSCDGLDLKKFKGKLKLCE
jgi:hypothetical protein